MSGDRENLVRQRAHEIWLREGQPDGQGERHWAMAEGEIEAELTSTTAKKATAKKPAPAKKPAVAKPSAVKAPAPKAKTKVAAPVAKPKTAAKNPAKAAAK